MDVIHLKALFKSPGSYHLTARHTKTVRKIYFTIDRNSHFSTNFRQVFKQKKTPSVRTELFVPIHSL